MVTRGIRFIWQRIPSYFHNESNKSKFSVLVATKNNEELPTQRVEYPFFTISPGNVSTIRQHVSLLTILLIDFSTIH